MRVRKLKRSLSFQIAFVTTLLVTNKNSPQTTFDKTEDILTLLTNLGRTGNEIKSESLFCASLSIYSLFFPVKDQLPTNTKNGILFP